MKLKTRDTGEDVVGETAFHNRDAPFDFSALTIKDVKETALELSKAWMT